MTMMSDYVEGNNAANLARYTYYAQHGIDEAHIADLDAAMLEQKETTDYTPRSVIMRASSTHA